VLQFRAIPGLDLTIRLDSGSDYNFMPFAVFEQILNRAPDWITVPAEPAWVPRINGTTVLGKVELKVFSTVEGVDLPVFIPFFVGVSTSWSGRTVDVNLTPDQPMALAPSYVNRGDATFFSEVYNGRKPSHIYINLKFRVSSRYWPIHYFLTSANSNAMSAVSFISPGHKRSIKDMRPDDLLPLSMRE